MADGQKQHTRAGSRHPIQLHEIAHLEALGNRLATVRHDRGFTQAGLAQKAELSTSAIGRIESGTRRTRRSTLERIARALERPDLADELARLAGPALAPESPHAERIARSRARRHNRSRAREEWAQRQARQREVTDTLRELSRQNREAADYQRYQRYGGC